jgi:hypothetical protein
LAKHSPDTATTSPTSAVSNTTTTTSSRRRPSAPARDSTQTNASSSVFSQTSNSTSWTATSSSSGVLSPADTSAGGRDRDSFVSIVDDPFFQRFHLDNAVHAERATSSGTASAEPHDDSNDNNNKNTQRWPPPRRESLTIGPSQYWVRIVFRHSLPHSSSQRPLESRSSP